MPGRRRQRRSPKARRDPRTRRSAGAIACRRKVIRARGELALEARAERKEVGEPLAGRLSSRIVGTVRLARAGSRRPRGGSARAPAGELRRDARHDLPRVAIIQRLGGQLVDPGRLERRRLALAKADDHDQRIGTKTPSDEGEGIGGWAVEPLDVVGDDQDRGPGGGIREQRQGRQGDEERVLGSSSTRPNATPSAAYCGFGSASSPPRIGRSSWWSPAKGRLASVLTPVVGGRAIRRPGPAPRPAPTAPTCRSPRCRGPGVPRHPPSRWPRGRRRSPAPGPVRGSFVAITGACSHGGQRLPRALPPWPRNHPPRHGRFQCLAVISDGHGRRPRGDLCRGP